MDKMLKFESPRHLSKIKTSNSLNDKINQHKKMKKKLRSSNDSPQDMQTLPVPTVPPYPIEYFENSSFGNTNRAFHCTDEFLENPNFKSSSSEEGKENETDSVKEKSLQKLVNSKLLPNKEINHEKANSDLNVIRDRLSLSKIDRSRTFNESKDLNLFSKSSQAQKLFPLTRNGSLPNGGLFLSNAPLRKAVSEENNNKLRNKKLSLPPNHLLESNSLSIPNPHKVKSKPKNIHSSSSSEHQYPVGGLITNGSLLSRNNSKPNREHISESRSQVCRSLTLKESSNMTLKLPDVGSFNCAPPPYPGPPVPNSNKNKHYPATMPRQQHRVTKVNSNNQQMLKLKPNNSVCQSKSARQFSENRKTPKDNTGRPGLNKPSDKTAENSAPNENKVVNQTISENLIRQFGIEKKERSRAIESPRNVIRQLNSVSKSLSPLYSKVCKPKKPKKVLVSDTPETKPHKTVPKSLSMSKSPVKSKKLLPGKENKHNGDLRCILQDKNDEDTTDGNCHVSPLYEDLKEFEDDAPEERKYNIEVRIDYSKGSKYKMETRETLTRTTVNKDSSEKVSTSTTSKKTTILNTLSEKKGKDVTKKIKEVGEMKSFKLGMIHVIRLGKWRFVALCCCG